MYCDQIGMLTGMWFGMPSDLKLGPGMGINSGSGSVRMIIKIIQNVHHSGMLNPDFIPVIFNDAFRFDRNGNWNAFRYWLIGKQVGTDFE